VTPLRGSIAAFLALVGAGAVWFRFVVLPRRPKDADRPRPRRIPNGPAKPAPNGDGVRIVVNPSSGPAWSPSPVDALREGLPGADIYELGEGDDLRRLLCDDKFPVIGAAGGDGTLAAAAAVAAERQALLVAIPAGTLNHLARDLGLDSVNDTIAAVREGFAAPIDLGYVGDRVFVNTLTFGGYSAVVDTRERFERHIGKWPALVVALVRELPRMEPLRLKVDGRSMRVWLGWIGNGAYSPPGLAPAWREALDDGLLDVRLVHDGPKFARTRFTCAALAGRLRTCAVYSEKRVESLEVECLDGPQRLAADGETFDGPASFTVTKKRRALRVAVPPPD
jgi:diacylglycerol kinase family enzyme